jgi:PAS domain S-box-containing protein
VLAVARAAGSAGLENGDADMLASFVDAVSTALENLLLDEEMRRQEAFRKDIMESMTSGLVAVDPAGRILGVNPRGEELAGRPVGSLRGEPMDVLDPDRRGMAALLRRTLGSGRAVTREELRLPRPDGTTLPVLCRTSLLRNPEGETYGAIVVFEDLTPLKAMEERIRQLDRLAALGRFTAGVAHEIRNPLGGIAAGVQYLERHLSGEDAQTENVAFLHREIRRLDRIVEDLFRVTHPSPPRRTPEDPRQLAEHAVRSLGSGPAEQGVEVTVEIPEGLPPVAVDPDQIQQVLLNLIKNAVEAVGPGGSVRLTAAEETAGPEPGVALRVRDSGPGIPPDALPHVFEPFFTQGKAEGTGLGLYVSHGIVERHGGELLAGNATDGGAVFTLRLPLTRTDSTEMVA